MSFGRRALKNGDLNNILLGGKSIDVISKEDRMKDYTQIYTAAGKKYDQGLAAYMLKIYNLMAAGLAITGVTAMATLYFEPLLTLLFQVTPDGRLAGYTGIGLLVAFAPLALVLYLNFGLAKMSYAKAQGLFWAYAAVMGLSLSSLGLLYTGMSIARVFFITSGVFGAVSLYGYSTKRDLTSFGSFLMMGVIGMIIASVVNIFLQSSALYYALSYIGVFVFVGLIAYDTQKLKAIYYSGAAGEPKLAIVGALNLYMDFINLFIHLLRILGDRRN